MHEKIPTIKLMYEGSDGRLILLKWPRGIWALAIISLWPLLLCTTVTLLFWSADCYEFVQYKVSNVCIHDFLRIYPSAQSHEVPDRSDQQWFSSEHFITQSIYFLFSGDTKTVTEWKTSQKSIISLVKWKMIIITSNQDELVCILQIS